jgi:hypothetical protein
VKDAKCIQPVINTKQSKLTKSMNMSKQLKTVKMFGKLSLVAGVILLLSVAASFLGGCATKRATVTTSPTTGLSTTNYSYVAPAIISNAPGYLETVRGIAPAPWGDLAYAAGMLGLGLYGAILRTKNSKLSDSNASQNAALSSIQLAAVNTGVPADFQAQLIKVASDSGAMAHPVVNTLVSMVPVAPSTPGKLPDPLAKP